MNLEFITFEKCHFGVFDITPRKHAQQTLSRLEATTLAQIYATHFNKGEIQSSQTLLELTGLPASLSRGRELNILDDYLWHTDTGGKLYNLGCVFCDLREVAEWEEEKTMRFLKKIYPEKVGANPAGWGEYARGLVEKTRALSLRVQSLAQNP